VASTETLSPLDAPTAFLDHFFFINEKDFLQQDMPPILVVALLEYYSQDPVQSHLH
jgi:hypothetical protein